MDTEETTVMTFKAKGTDAARRVVFGWAMVCTEKNGKPYVDTQDEHIPPSVIMDSAIEFMLNSRKSDDMHDEGAGGDMGEVVFAWPFLDGVSNEPHFALPAQKRGLAVGVRYSEEIFSKFLSGEYTGFSIGGFATAKAIKDGYCVGCEKLDAECTCGTAVAKAKKYTGLKLKFISAVTYPAQEGAQALVVAKSGTRPTENLMDPQLLTLTGPQFEVYKTLGPDDQKAFLALPSAARDVQVAKAAELDPVVYTSKSTGVKIRKSHGEIAKAMAEDNDRLHETLEAQKMIAEAAVYKGRVAEDIPHIPLTSAQAIEMLVAIDNGVKNEETKAAIKSALGAASKALGGATVVIGATGGEVEKAAPGSNYEGMLIKKVHAYAREKKISTMAAYDEFLDTDEGRALKVKADEQKARREAVQRH